MANQPEQQDREHWNRRYSSGQADWLPNGWLVQHEALIQPRQNGRRAVDLACGTGQNSLYLAGLGFRVDAWDISDVALDRLRSRLAVVGPAHDIALRQLDLASAKLPASTYDLVLDINFLERRLFQAMTDALVPNGLLLIRTLMRKDGVSDDRNPSYLLEPGELAAAFPQLQKLDYAEDTVEGWAALVARQGDAC